jgi:hypothetical protein
LISYDQLAEELLHNNDNGTESGNYSKLLEKNSLLSPKKRRAGRECGAKQRLARKEKRERRFIQG